MTTPGFIPRLCPNGHPAGTVFGTRRCSGKSCGEEKNALALATGPRQIKPKMGEGEVNYLKRKSLARVPDEAMDGEKAVDWGKEKLTQMVPEAVAQLQWDLRYGGDRTRSEAAAKVLAANGLDKREAAVSRSMPTIVLNIGTADTKAPWLERLKKADK